MPFADTLASGSESVEGGSLGRWQPTRHKSRKPVKTIDLIATAQKFIS
jgi:hypothetical protein